MPENTPWTGSKMVQTARVRMAWSSTVVTAAMEKKKTELAEGGQDMLSAPERRTLEQRWWMRYKLTPEAGGMP